MDEKNALESTCTKLQRYDEKNSSMLSWCYGPKFVNGMKPTVCIFTSTAQQQDISDTQQHTQTCQDRTQHSVTSTNDSGAQTNCHDNNVVDLERTDNTETNTSQSSPNFKSLENSAKTSTNKGGVFVDISVTKTKTHRVPSTPTLIVSDTNTGVDNCVLESAVLPIDFFARPKKKIEDLCKTFGSQHSSLDETDSCIGTETTTESENNSPTETRSVDHALLSPRRSCDSAYGSCMETALSLPADDLNPTSVADSDITIDNINDGAASSLSSAEDSSHHSTYGTSLSVYLPCKTSSSLFSSTSSIASDSAAEASCGGEDSASSSVDKDSLKARKLSSSSICSLRSTLSFEESEEDFASGDDASLNAIRVKAQKSWTKLRRMVIWSPFMQSFKKKYPWVQLAGHAGNFQPGEEGCILKKYVEREAECLKGLTADPFLRDFAPTFRGVVHRFDEKYTRMQDLLMPFESPSLMDCKMGIRTYLEDELVKAKVKPRLRHDMYQKMIDISPNEPTPEEHKQEAVTKPRYMQWREQVSSTSNLGFRIEGIKKSKKDPSKGYKLTKTAAQVTTAFQYFIDSNVSVLEKYIARLKSMRDALGTSDFFHSHEAIGSSLLFVHDDTGLANIWMIDFGKTSRLPGDQKIDHRKEWIEGNREDGYIFGMDNMISIFENILQQLAPDSIPTTATSSSRVNGMSENIQLQTSENRKHLHGEDTMISRVHFTIGSPAPFPKRQVIKRRIARIRLNSNYTKHSGGDNSGDVTENDVIRNGVTRKDADRNGSTERTS